MPTWLETVGLVVLLAFIIKKTAEKGIKTWRQETTEKKKKEVTGPALHCGLLLQTAPCSPSQLTLAALSILLCSEGAKRLC